MMERPLVDCFIESENAETGVFVFDLHVAIVIPVPPIDDFDDIDRALVPIKTSRRHARIA